MPERKTCSDCLFFHEESLSCHRYPPQMILWPLQDKPDKTHYLAIWPYVEEFGWCGEWQNNIYKRKPTDV